MSPSPGASNPHSGIRNVSSSSSGSATATATDQSRMRRRRHSRALEHRLKNVVDIVDASRLMECSQIQRQIRLQQLVRRYMSQILYGCNAAHCTTSTCLSCNKRLVTRPFRAPTQLTARALAHFLSTQENPDRGLCPHQLIVEPTSLEIEGTRGIEIGRSGRSKCLPKARPLYRTSVATQTGKHASSQTSEAVQEKHCHDDVGRTLTSVKERVQARKDSKSLSQNLFDTVTLIYSYSRQIPSALAVFTSLRSSSDDDADSSTHYEAIWEDAADDLVSSSSTGNTSHVRTCSSTISSNVTKSRMPIKSAICSPPRVSSAHVPTSNGVFEASRNRQRVHKVRHNLADAVSYGSPPWKAKQPTLLDGTLDSSELRIAAMKEKPITLDAHGRNRASPVASPPTRFNSGHEIRAPYKSNRPALPVVEHLSCDIMEQLKEEVYQQRNEQSSSFDFVVDYDTHQRFRAAKPFVNRSLFYTLSDPETLLKSFHETDNKAYKKSPLSHLNSTRLTHAFRDWNRRNGALIFDSLWIAVEALFRPPPELDVENSPHLRASHMMASADRTSEFKPSSEKPKSASNRYLSDEEAAHIVMICIHALTSLIPVGWPRCWIQLRNLRSWGVTLPSAPPHKDFTDRFVDPWLTIIDELEYEPAVRLADRLVRGIGARLCFERVLVALRHREIVTTDPDHPSASHTLTDILVKHLAEIERLAVAGKVRMKTSLNYDEDPGWTVTATFMEWLRTIIIKKWDGKAVINRWSSVGAAIDVLHVLHINRSVLNLRSGMFYMPYLNERLDPVNDPVKYLELYHKYHPNSLHVLQYPFLFLPEYLVSVFRTINFMEMFKHYEQTERVARLQRGLDPYLREPYWWHIRDQLKVTLADYLVLDVNRERALHDTLDQLWCQERRMLLKPLKIKMGMEEGEVGLDQGGVTSEFFRVVLNEAFMPDNGMFTVDPQTRMTWFQPASLEPDWKFEMLGVVFSLAIYNGVTLPITFPLALYHSLVTIDVPRLPDKTNFIRDGWPMLAKSFEELLTWKDGDVADVFMRSYSFSFDAFGRNIDVDIQAFDQHSSGINLWPADYDGKVKSPSTISGIGRGEPIWPSETSRPDLSSPAWERPLATRTGSPIEHANEVSETEESEGPPMVTNANREQYVADYIFWLTFKSVAPQLLAFRRGFLTCLNVNSLRLFDAQSFKRLVEGTQTISISLLKPATRYEAGYSSTHPTIIDFWSVVEEYSQSERRKLLEFVTASERVPVTGFKSMNFVIVRNGVDTEMLPTSSTCFGKLMLPQYEGREKLKKKLDLAIQNSEGFGIV